MPVLFFCWCPSKGYLVSPSSAAALVSKDDRCSQCMISESAPTCTDLVMCWASITCVSHLHSEAVRFLPDSSNVISFEIE